MKIKGLTKVQFMIALSQAHSKLAFKYTPVPASDHATMDKSGVIEGYPFFQSLTWLKSYHTPCVAVVNGEPVHKPCAHGVQVLIKACLVAGATDVWAEKIHFTKHTGGWQYSQLVTKLAKGTLKKAGMTCGCDQVKLSPHDGPKPTPTALSTDEIEKAWSAHMSTVNLNLKFLTPLSLHGKKVNHPCNNASTHCLWCVKGSLASGATSGKAKPEPIPELVPASGTPLSAEPLPGDIEPGEVALIPKGKSRDVHAVVTSLYLLVEMDIALDKLAPRKVEEYDHEVDADGEYRGKCKKRLYREFKGESAENYNIADRVFVDDFTCFKRDFENTLARNMFDYLTIASAAEFRYGHGVTGWADYKKPTERSAAQFTSLKYDPRTMLPVMQKGFNTLKWSGSFGGQKWGTICKAASYYLKFNKDFPIVFIDHCVDLAHNGGLAFNKGYILHNPASKSDYIEMLDKKRNGSLLDGSDTLLVTTEIYLKLGSFVRSGLLDRSVLKRCKVTDDPRVPTVQWGDKPFHVNIDGPIPTQALEVNDPDVEGEEEHSSSETTSTLTPERKAS